MEIDSYVSSCTKLNFKQIKDINKRLDTLNLTEEKIGDNVEHLAQEKVFCIEPQ